MTEANIPDACTYEKNLRLFKESNPLAALSLESASFRHIRFCTTKKGEANIVNERFGLFHYYHDQNGAREEAEKIVDTEIRKDTDIVYFYGIGLGYFYEAAQKWLHGKPTRRLIYLEDDLEVFHCFLQTPLASKALQDPQALFFRVNFEENNFYELNRLMVRFPLQPIQFVALPSYIDRKEENTFRLSSRILFDNTRLRYLNGEYLSGHAGFLRQFYFNLLHIPESYSASGLFGAFKNIPAIICGAGPSLQKNIGLLRTLTDRALIFAGGSALNVLNAEGITPHFGLGIDPNDEQSHRLLTNNAFHIPFFYRNRMEHQAFRLLSGPKIYVPGSTNGIAAWFEEKLGLSGPLLDEGHNVVTFATEIARNMGCNPIIYVGMDLAYTDVQTYAKGIAVHPLWLGKSDPYIPAREQLLSRTGLDQKEVTTKWEWMAEANWTNHYALSHPEITMINATEGGLGFATFPNISLRDAAERFLTGSYDLSSRIHGIIQESPVRITRGDLFVLLNEYKTSLENCIAHCSVIIAEQTKNLTELPKHETKPSAYTGISVLHENLLHEETAYQWFLENIDTFYSNVSDAKIKRTTVAEQNNRLLSHYNFLRSALTGHLNILVDSVQKFILSAPPFPVTEKEAKLPCPVNDEEIYFFENGRLRIEDPDAGISTVFNPIDSTEYYPDGKIKSVTFYTREGLLQGPSRFYGTNGILLAESRYFQGKKQGKTYLFYDNGSLFSLQRFRDNRPEGKQEYFFRNGKIKSTSYYERSQLEGEVKIYDSQGNLERQLRYKNGLRDGIETMRDHHSRCIMECRYERGIPKGTAKQFDSSGRLRKEVTIRTFPDDFDSVTWDEQGKITQVFKEGIEDFFVYYEEKLQQIRFLEQAIKMVLDRLELFVKEQNKTGGTEPSSEILQELAAVRASMQQLDTLKAELQTVREESMRASDEARKKKKSDRL